MLLYLCPFLEMALTHKNLVVSIDPYLSRGSPLIFCREIEQKKENMDFFPKVLRILGEYIFFRINSVVAVWHFFECPRCDICADDAPLNDPLTQFDIWMIDDWKRKDKFTSKHKQILFWIKFGRVSYPAQRWMGHPHRIASRLSIWMESVREWIRLMSNCWSAKTIRTNWNMFIIGRPAAIRSRRIVPI